MNGVTSFFFDSPHNCWDDFLTPNIDEMPDRFELEYNCPIIKKYMRIFYMKNEPYTPEFTTKIGRVIFSLCMACTQRSSAFDNTDNECQVP
jgi:hypothetical protein